MKITKEAIDFYNENGYYPWQSGNVKARPKTGRFDILIGKSGLFEFQNMLGKSIIVIDFLSASPDYHDLYKVSCDGRVSYIKEEALLKHYKYLGEAF